MSLFDVTYAPLRTMNKYGIYDLDEIQYKDPSEYPNPTSVYDTYTRENYQETFYQLLLKYKLEYDSTMFVEEENYEGNTTTINEFVRRAPKSKEEFLEWIQSRLHVRHINYLSAQNQQELIDICCLEVKFQWKEITRNIEDNSLTREELIELKRRLYVNVISICEKLFNYYIKRADTLKSREVFSDEANFTRIKTLLACDLNRFLSIHQLKHHLAFDLKMAKKKTQETRLVPPRPKEFLNLKRLSVKNLIEDFRLKYRTRGRRYKTIKEHLKDIYDNMPVLETRKIERMLQKLPQNVQKSDQTNDGFEEQLDAPIRTPMSDLITPVEESENDEILLDRLVLNASKLKLTNRFRSKSMIELADSSLAEELGLDRQLLVRDRYNTTDLVVRKSIFRLSKPEMGNLTGKKIDFSLIGRESDKTVALRIKKDLEFLTFEVKRRDSISLDNDDQPLLMNLTSKADQKNYIAQVKSKIKAINQRRKKFLQEIQLPLVQKKTHVQPSTLEIVFNNNFSIRLSDVRVSTRVLRFNITCELFPPLYNDLTSEIDSEMIQNLDRNLFIGGEVKEIYDELLKTVEQDHLRFDLDPYVQKAPSSLKFESGFSSSVLRSFGRTKSINPNLAGLSRSTAPWSGQNFKEWNKTYVNSLFFKDNLIKKPLHQQYQEENSRVKSSMSRMKTDLKPEKRDLYNRCDPTKLENKEIKHWFEWWKTNFTSEDYFKYISTQNSDYLGLLFHLYDDEKDRAVELTDYEIYLENERKKAEKDRLSLIEELKKQKYSYEHGLWNSNSVLLGGLGNDPTIDQDLDPLVRMRKELENSRPKSRKVQLFRSSDKQETDEEEKAKLKMIHSLKEKIQESPKDRLERVWTMLRMSDSEKIDMAVKYCTSDYAPRLTQALTHWETAAELIIKREQVIYDLEHFERYASDPNRYYVKGHRGSSAARLEEALQREKLYKKIDHIQKLLEPVLIEIGKLFNDTIRYNGRPYLEKMKWDRIEMLHYLTEERRLKYFRHEVKSKQLPDTTLAEI